MQPQLFTLSNGLRVLFIDTKAFSSITTLLLVGAGSRYENEKNNGIAHFFEHMAFKGSKKYPNSLVISSVIEGLGGIFNAFTSKDHTGYWVKATNEHFDTVIDVLSDMVLNSLLKKEEIEREKGVIVEEINMYEDTPQKKVGEVFEGLLYKGNSLGYYIAGTKDTVRAFNRKTFTDYMNNLYNPENAVLIVAGGLSKVQNVGAKRASPLQNYLNIIQSKFSDWKKAEKTGFTNIKESQGKPQQFIKYKKTEQAHFCLGFRTFSFFDDRKYALNVLSTLLGSGMSSRLFIEVRERRGLCYYISTGRELYHDVGNIITQAGVSNNIDKVKEAVEVILKEHKKIVDGQVEKKELERVKEMIKGRISISMEDSINIANYYGAKLILENKTETPDEVIYRIEKITIEDIVKLASEIFTPERLNFAMIGPFQDTKIDLEI